MTRTLASIHSDQYESLADMVLDAIEFSAQYGTALVWIVAKDAEEFGLIEDALRSRADLREEVPSCPFRAFAGASDSEYRGGDGSGAWEVHVEPA